MSADPVASCPSTTPPPNKWEQLWEGQSGQYIEKFAALEAEHADLGGEARLVAVLAAPGGTVLDAGCGTGRVASRIAALGFETVGIEKDPLLIAEAKSRYGNFTVVESDLCLADRGFLAAQGVCDQFDVIVVVGNVMVFLAPGTEGTVLANLRSLLKPTGRLVVGYASGMRGGVLMEYPEEQFMADVKTAGLTIENRYSTFDLRPVNPEDPFTVTVLTVDAPDE